MSALYIDDAERKRLATRWVGVTLAALHGWATLLVLAVLFNRSNGEVVAAMFSTVTFGIGATLAILLLDRAADVVLARFSAPAGPPVAVTETVTRTVAPGAPAEVAAKDVNIQADGNVNVSNASS